MRGAAVGAEVSCRIIAAWEAHGAREAGGARIKWDKGGREGGGAEMNWFVGVRKLLRAG